MLKKTITYQDFDGNTRTEDFFFNLTQAELVALELSEKGGLAEVLKEIVESEDGAMIVKKFQEIILLAYGVKSDDGRRFIKTQELRDEFAQTAAYSELFVELATNAEAAAIFVNGIVPANAAKGIPDAANASVRAKEAPVTSPPILPAHSAAGQPQTREELLAALAALPPEGSQ